MVDLTVFSEEMKGTEYPISKVAANEWKSFAMYTVESRAIPNMIDGLKPVQRFYLYSSIQNTKRDFKKVKNPDLWKEYIEVSAQHKIHATWVRGHDGHIENERCDDLARGAAEAVKKLK